MLVKEGAHHYRPFPEDLQEYVSVQEAQVWILYLIKMFCNHVAGLFEEDYWNFL